MTLPATPEKLDEFFAAVDAPEGQTRIVLVGRAVYERMTAGEIKWVEQRYKCQIAPPMSKGITPADIEAARDWHQGGAMLSTRELAEALANAPNPCPMTALCDRHDWRRPSMADYAFIEACGKRLGAKLDLALATHRATRVHVRTHSPTGLRPGDPVTVTGGHGRADGFAVDGLVAIPE